MLQRLTSFSNGGATPLTVCHVLHSLNVGGAEMLVVRLARKLRDKCRFVFACLDELGVLGEELRKEGFTVEVLDRKPGFDPGCAWRLGRFWRRERVHVVHAHQYGPFFYSVAARLLWRRPAIIFTEHGRTFPDYPRRKRIIANRILLERRDRVVGVGEAVRRALIRNEGIPQRRVGVIYNGIDTAVFANGCHDRDLIRRELGMGPDDFVIFQVARLDHLKDHATAVRTMHRVRRDLPAARLVLVGEGPERGKIEESIDRHRLADHVRLLGLRNDVARLLRAADLFLLTSISEGIPLTVIEAMAAELPVVSTRVGGLAEIIEDGRTGFLAAAGDDAALAERICRLASDAPLRRQLGQCGKVRAATMFSEDQMHLRYLELYRSGRGVRAGSRNSERAENLAG
ncbi:MAG: glycosyltransferase [Gemmataceae bacterium]|nr:glycosyltransferase [Gemmataceae bacterium]